jgi:hypothetical protein
MPLLTGAYRVIFGKQNHTKTKGDAKMSVMFRYMVDEVMRGGCVLAENLEQAKIKVEAYYAGILDDGFVVTVWLEGDTPEDVVQVYP